MINREMSTVESFEFFSSKRSRKLDLSALWQYRELLYFLVWRDVKVRYKQTALGVLWILLQPLISTVIFAIVFGLFLKVQTGQVPYPLFAFAGFVPWTYFATAVNRSASSLVNNASLITKVYFPRLILPLSGILNGIIDFFISLAVLLIAAIFFGFLPSIRILALPFFIILAMMAALSVSLWISAVTVRYRDVNQIVPFLLQAWMYATPVIYPATVFPARYRWLVGLNPMAGVIEGVRWCLLYTNQPPDILLAISVMITAVLLVAGLFYFRNVERTFADVV